MLQNPQEANGVAEGLGLKKTRDIANTNARIQKKKKHKVILIGDSHARSCAEKLSGYIGTAYEVTGDRPSNRSSKFPLTDMRVAAVHAPHFFTAPTHAPTMHLATQNAASLPPTHLAASSLERQVGREVVALASNRLSAG